MKVRHLIEKLETCAAGSPVKAVLRNAEEIGSFSVDGILSPIVEGLEKEAAYLTLQPDREFEEVLRRYFRDAKDGMKPFPWWGE